MNENLKTPIRVNYSGETPIGISEYQTNESIPVLYGGTGQVNVDRGQIIVGDISDQEYKTKKFTDTAGFVTCMFDETWLTGIGMPVNQTTFGTTQFYSGETIYQGLTVETSTASAIIIENSGVSATFKVKSINGTFVAGEVVWAENAENESGQKRAIPLTSDSNTIIEQDTVKFFIGTLDSVSGEYTIDCGTL